MKKILLFILIFISIISCSQKEKVLDEKSKKEVFAKDFAIRRLHKIVFPEVFSLGTLWFFTKKTVCPPICPVGILSNCVK